MIYYILWATSAREKEKDKGREIERGRNTVTDMADSMKERDIIEEGQILAQIHKEGIDSNR